MRYADVIQDEEKDSDMEPEGAEDLCNRDSRRFA